LGRVVIVLLLGAAGVRAQVGEVTFANSGAAAAQPAFLHGLAQLHNFEYGDAARAFREAQQQDPGFAMAYWGEAMTKNHPVWMEQDLGGARRVLERLGPTSVARLAKAGTDRERAYLGAVEVLYGPGDKRARDLAYLDEMRRVHAAYPDDVDAAAFYALALLGSAHDGRDVAIYMQAAAVLEESFAAHPNHPGRSHYLINSYDDPTHAPLGLRAARRYSSIATEAPHALHMTSHIYLAAGMWDEVVAANEQASTVAAERARRAGQTPGGCGHANMWLMYGYLQQGRPSQARRILAACRASASGERGLSVRAPEQDPLDPDNIPAGSYIQMWSRYLIDTADWAAESADDKLPLGDLLGARLTRDFVNVLRAAALHSDTAALNERALQFDVSRKALEIALHTRKAGADRYSDRAGILASEVRALTLAADRRLPEAVSVLREAAAAEDAMPVEFGPPFVDKPAHELLGDVLLAANRPEEALAAYRAALSQAPKRTSSLLGAARAATRSGDAGAARDAYALLTQIWHQAEHVPDDVKAAGGRAVPF
jgi:tetratricopeptide (TPR) repeat protein